MAFNKAKALQEAHKYMTQGKIAQAIEHYVQIVEKDPDDLNLLNIIGDLYVQENNIPEALRYFYRLADAYTKERYQVKAVAIYKKISKVDRTSAEPLLKLAELNAAQGLTREAREQYESAFEFFERANQKDKALGILRQLCQLDPKSPSLRMKLAEYAERAGQSKESADAYLESAMLAQQAGEVSSAESALKKAGELAPEKPEVCLFRAHQALTNQKPEEVQAILDCVPDLRANLKAQRLLLESYLVTGNLDAARGLLLDVFQSNPSDFSFVAEFAACCIEKQQYDVALEVLAAIAPGLIERRETAPLMKTLRALWEAAPEQIDTLELVYHVAEKTADEAAVPEVLEALGNAYIQSDQPEKAEEAYARLVAREPENEGYTVLLKQALEKQGKEYVPLGQNHLMDGDAGLGSELDSSDEGTGVVTAQDNEEALSLAQTATNAEGDSKVDISATQPGGGALRPPASVKIDLLQTVAEDGALVEAQLPPPQDIALEFQTGQASEQVSGGVPANLRNSPVDKTSPATPQLAPSSGTSPVFNYDESRDEIEFYLRHAFYDEARKAVSELEEKYPGEIRVAELRRSVEALNRSGDVGGATGKKSELEFELPTSFSEASNPGSPAEVARTARTLETSANPLDAVEHPASELAPVVDISDDPADIDITGVGKSAGLSSLRSSEDASSELSSLLDDLNDLNDPIDQAADDDQTHYNLGVAFREMGLLDEAIGEFQKVVRHGGPKSFSPNFLQGCTLLAACFMDKGMPTIAATWYTRALDAPGLGHEGKVALYYDLGIAFEKAGNTTAALEKFTEVYSQNIDYRDVAEKIHLLRESAS